MEDDEDNDERSEDEEDDDSTMKSYSKKKFFGKTTKDVKPLVLKTNLKLKHTLLKVTVEAHSALQGDFRGERRQDLAPRPEHQHPQDQTQRLVSRCDLQIQVQLVPQEPQTPPKLRHEQHSLCQNKRYHPFSAH